MAMRPVFIATTEKPYFKEIKTEFKYFNGFSTAQKQKSILSLHAAFNHNYNDYKVLEISSKSENVLGIKLSAFNLMIHSSKRLFSVESAFQGSKVFQHGGPFTDLLDKPSAIAKKDERIKNNGELVSFRLFDRDYPLEPKDFFYNWLYINALNQNKELWDELLNYDAFTDIEFNPKKSINCQARSVAVFVGLTKANLLNEALKSKEAFIETVYGKPDDEFVKTYEQLRFD